jgi:hypothetical protein
MTLLIVSFGNDAPLHRATVDGSGSGKGFWIAPTGGAMVNNHILAVGDAERFASHVALFLPVRKRR